MNTSPKLLKKYDHILIGYNLTSMSFALELAKANQSFCLLDSKHLISSPFKKVSSIDKTIYSRLPFNSFDEELTKISNAEQVENAVTTFDKGDFKSFLGFGDSKVEAMDAVEPYCNPTAIKTTETPEEFWDEANEALVEHIHLDQQVTDIQLEGNQVEAITLNGKTIVKGEHFYFFDQLPFLIDKVAPSIKKLASQFAKAKWFSSTNLIVHHKNTPDNVELETLYLLKGSKEQGCLGWFTQMDDQLISRWESFFQAELTADSETTGTTLKEIKKQIKRAFSKADPQDVQEHILIQNQVYADLSKSGLQNGKLSNFNNLYVYSPLISGQIGWLHERELGRLSALELVSPKKSQSEAPIEVAAPSSPC